MHNVRSQVGCLPVLPGSLQVQPIGRPSGLLETTSGVKIQDPVGSTKKAGVAILFLSCGYCF